MDQESINPISCYSIGCLINSAKLQDIMIHFHDNLLRISVHFTLHILYCTELYYRMKEWISNDTQVSRPIHFHSLPFISLNKVVCFIHPSTSPKDHISFHCLSLDFPEISHKEKEELTNNRHPTHSPTGPGYI